MRAIGVEGEEQRERETVGGMFERLGKRRVEGVESEGETVR